jgi:glycosyltransferase involved in cell wall biosynthesis
VARCRLQLLAGSVGDASLSLAILYLCSTVQCRMPAKRVRRGGQRCSTPRCVALAALIFGLWLLAAVSYRGYRIGSGHQPTPPGHEPARPQQLIIVMAVESASCDLNRIIPAYLGGNVSGTMLVAVPTHLQQLTTVAITGSVAKSVRFWVHADDKRRSAVIREAVGVALSQYPRATQLMLGSCSRVPFASGFVDQMVDALEISGESTIVSCTSIMESEETGYEVYDSGLVATEGNIAGQQTYFVSRRYFGLAWDSRKLRRASEVDFVTPHCALMPRKFAEMLATASQGVDVAAPPVATLPDTILEVATRLHWLGRYCARIVSVNQPSPEVNTFIAQLDNFRRQLIPIVKEIVLRFTGERKLIARLDISKWNVGSADNITAPADLKRYLQSQVDKIFIAYRRLKSIDVDIGALAGDLTLLNFCHDARANGATFVAVAAFAVFHEKGIAAETLSMKDRGFSIVAPSVPLLGPPLFPSLSAEVQRGSFHGDDDADARLFILWDTVCCGCCGFSSEIMHFLHPLRKLRFVRTTVGRDCFCSGYDGYIADNIRRMYAEPTTVAVVAPPTDIVIWVSHAAPWSYYNHELVLRRPDYFIGRSMYEFTKIPSEWIAQIKPINEVWVPGEWVRDTFVMNGVDASKVLVMPEAIDVDYFDPQVRARVALPLTGAEEHWSRHCNGPGDARNFNFFSNFKWEPRKGWDVLFDAYFSAFSSADAVSLYVLTNFLGTPFLNVTQIYDDFERWATAAGHDPASARMPHYCIVTELVKEEIIGDFYNSADAFVLPTRGEGWGLPTIQAMALAKPTISTNYGGQLEFMTPDTSFLIELDGVVEIPEDSQYGFMTGKKWAAPSVRHTAELMRYVHQERAHAAEVGKRARERIVGHFTEDAIAATANKRFNEVRSWIKHLRHAKK